MLSRLTKVFAISTKSRQSRKHEYGIVQVYVISRGQGAHPISYPIHEKRTAQPLTESPVIIHGTMSRSCCRLSRCCRRVPRVPESAVSSESVSVAKTGVQPVVEKLPPGPTLLRAPISDQPTCRIECSFTPALTSPLHCPR